MDEASLKAKLAAIEALYEGATSVGEREAAATARVRIRGRLERLAQEAPPVEYRFTLADVWNRRLFMALLRRYELTPFRYSGQRNTTVMVKVPKRFVDETLWPQYVELSKTLSAYLNEVTERVISEAVHRDASDTAEVVNERVLGPGGSAED